MTAYVDAPVHPLGRMMMCHLVADTLEELHQMADKIGVNRKWFQDKTRYPHYDICKSKRALAIAAGAIEVRSRDIIPVAKALRTQMISQATACGTG